MQTVLPSASKQATSLTFFDLWRRVDLWLIDAAARVRQATWRSCTNAPSARRTSALGVGTDSPLHSRLMSHRPSASAAARHGQFLQPRTVVSSVVPPVAVVIAAATVVVVVVVVVASFAVVDRSATVVVVVVDFVTAGVDR